MHYCTFINVRSAATIEQLSCGLAIFNFNNYLDSSQNLAEFDSLFLLWHYLTGEPWLPLPVWGEAVVKCRAILLNYRQVIASIPPVHMQAPPPDYRPGCRCQSQSRQWRNRTECSGKPNFLLELVHRSIHSDGSINPSKSHSLCSSSEFTQGLTNTRPPAWAWALRPAM